MIKHLVLFILTIYRHYLDLIDILEDLLSDAYYHLIQIGFTCPINSHYYLLVEYFIIWAIN